MKNNFDYKDASEFIEKHGGKKTSPLEISKKSGAILKKICFGQEFVNLIGNIKVLINMVNDYAHKKYQKVPKKTIAAICGALFYVLSPIDAIPDDIPGVGYLDDVAVVEHLLKSFNDDIEEYKEWSEEQTKAA